MVSRSPLRAKVRGADGRPIANARLWVESASEVTEDIAALSDERGEVVLSVPSGGDFAIVCGADGFGTTRTIVEVDCRADMVIELVRDA